MNSVVSGANPTGLPILRKREPCQSRGGGGLQPRSYPVRTRGAIAPSSISRSALCIAAGRQSGGSLHFLMKQVAARPARANSLQVSSPPDFQNARVAQLYRVLRFERSGCRLESCREYHFPDVAQCRGAELRPRIVWVRVLPSGPTSKTEREPDQRAGSLC